MMWPLRILLGKSLALRKRGNPGESLMKAANPVR